jgi:hypothetical protein
MLGHQATISISGHHYALHNEQLVPQYDIYTYFYYFKHNTLKSPEELLIDFCEVIGEHSGENMAHAIYDTMKMYNLRGKVNHLFLVIYLGDELN